MLADDGVLMIEVHHAGKILSELQYDSIYHEHASYISLTALNPILIKFGLEVFRANIGPISGGCLTLFVKKRSCKNFQVHSEVAELIDDEIQQGVGNLSSWTEFASRADKHRTDLKAKLQSLKVKGLKVCGYGASARSSTLLNFCEINDEYLDCIADNNDLKQGLYTAGTNVKIVSPEEMYRMNPDYILLLAWNFQSEIMATIRSQGFKNAVMVPLPNYPKLVQSI
jgi:hypothetical protein